MNFIICIAIAWILSYYGNKVIRKHANLFYMISVGISTVLIIGTATGLATSLPQWLRTSIWSIFAWGSFATALFVLVMFAGAVPKGSVIQKTIIPIRKELSIIASILTLGHNFSAGQVYFVWLFTKPERLQGPLLWATFCSIALILLMLPLFVTSFTFVRKKMKPKSWKNLQRLSYLFYGLIYIHVLLLFVPKAQLGQVIALINVAAFSIIFLSYGAMRIRKALEKKGTLLQNVSIIAALGLFLMIGFISMPSQMTKATTEVNTQMKNTEPQNKQDTNMNTEQGTDQTKINNLESKENIASTDTKKTTADTSASQSETEKTDEATPVTEPTKPSDNSENQSETISPVNPQVQKPKEIDTKTADNVKTDTADKSANNTDNNDTKAEKSEVPSKTEPAQKTETQPTPATDISKTETSNTETPSQSTETSTSTAEPDPEPTPTPVFKYKNGQFIGNADGYNGPITVNVTIQDDVITAITISAHSDDEPFITNAKAITGAILSAQNTEVNTVSGATFSSRGIKDAVKAALNSAKN